MFSCGVKLVREERTFSLTNFVRSRAFSILCAIGRAWKDFSGRSGLGAFFSDFFDSLETGRRCTQHPAPGLWKIAVEELRGEPPQKDRGVDGLFGV